MGDERMQGFVAGAAFATFLLVMGRALDVELTRVVTERAIVKAIVESSQHQPPSSSQERAPSISQSWEDDDEHEDIDELT